MALPVLQNNPVIGEMAMRGSSSIVDGLANLGASIKENLEKEAILTEAREAAPFLNAAYQNAFSAFRSGDIGEGYGILIDATTKYPTNPLVANLNKMALAAGQSLASSTVDLEIAKARSSGGGNKGLLPSQVDAQFNEADPNGIVPTSTDPNPPDWQENQDNPDNIPLVEDSTQPNSGPVVQTQKPIVNDKSQGPTQQQKIAGMDPTKRAQVSSPVLDTEGVSEDAFEVYEVPEDLRPFFLEAKGIGLPKKSETSVSDTKTVNSRGTYSRSQNKSTSDPKVSKETKDNFDAVMKSAGTLKSSQGIQKAIKEAGGFQNLQRAEQTNGAYGKEQNAITWPGNTGKPIQVSDSEMKAFDAIQSLPAMASTSGAKFFGAPVKDKSLPVGTKLEAKKVGVPRAVVEALKANPRDANAIAELRKQFGADAERIQMQIVNGR